MRNFTRSVCLYGLAAWLVAGWSVSAMAAEDYLSADVQIQGKEIHTFEENGEQVALVMGDFRLTVGKKREVASRDAVVWIVSHEENTASYHDIIVYAEGGAKVIEPSGAMTEDKHMIVTVHSKGRLNVSGKFSQRPLEEFPLYRRAIAQRKQWKTERLEPASQADVAHAAPLLEVSSQPAPPRTPLEPTTIPSDVTEIPAPETGFQDDIFEDTADHTAEGLAEIPLPAEAMQQTPSSRQTPTPPAFAPDKITEPQEILPVTFSADRFSSEMQEGRRVTIARGNVYLSQGASDSLQFVELRAQSAVLFSVKGARDQKDTTTPFAAPVQGFGPEQEAVTGVYLEGDVLIARGERYFRGPAAYYDFTTDRAIIIDPVFRTIQEQREIPIYVRASEARTLSAREVYFRDARISTSDFYTPSYHIGAKRAYLMDTTPYDAEGKQIGERSMLAETRDTTFNIGGVPILYSPGTKGEMEQGNTPLRRAGIGSFGKFGMGVETEWHLFRLLGILKPEGFKGTVNLDWYKRGGVLGTDLEYYRKNFSGYSKIYGVYDSKGYDEFGAERKHVDAETWRGRILMRHKQYLPNDWQVQFELSYASDRNFLEEFFPNEFYAGKKQETLIYVKKQTDNWAFSALVQPRLNEWEPYRSVVSYNNDNDTITRYDWEGMAESYPDMALYLLGEPLADNNLTFFHESHAGLLRYRMPEDFMFFPNENTLFPAVPAVDDPFNPRPGINPNGRFSNYESDVYLRLDTRNEVTLPSHIGPINLAPYSVGRLSYWSDNWRNEDQFRPYGQVGFRMNTHLWRVYNNVKSRLWNVNRLKHIITPEATAFVSSSHGVYANEGDMYYVNPDIEGIERTSGTILKLMQRLQTKRGPADNLRTVDWMRFDLSMGIFDNNLDGRNSGSPMRSLPSGSYMPPSTSPFVIGRGSDYRPENSLDRNYLNGEYTWHISDSVTLLSDGFYDMDDMSFIRGNIGLAVQRDPRLRYYAGLRYLEEMKSTVGTLGLYYKLSTKYSISAFQQYDFLYNDGRNLATAITITRKLPRWYVSVTFAYDNENEISVIFSLWPEGIEEVMFGSGKLALSPQSDEN